MGRLRVAFERFGRSFTALFARSREPGPVADVEAGTTPFAGDGTIADPDAAVGAEPAPSFRNRARLRRRLRYLRQTRELGFRDLGGFMFDSKRFGRERDDIVGAKLEGLNAIDRELRALELALDDVQEVTLLHEPGISVCPRCGALHGSEDNYCPTCGLPVGRGLGLAVAQGGPGGAVVTAAAAPTAPPLEAEATAETPAAAAASGEAAPPDVAASGEAAPSAPPAPAAPSAPAAEDDAGAGAGAEKPAARRRASAKAPAADDSAPSVAKP